MEKPNALIPTSEIVDPLSLMDLCRICGSSADWVNELVDEGILEPTGHNRSVWRFESTSIATIHKVQRLQSDLRLNMPGIALVLTLVDENATLKRQLRYFENDPDVVIQMPGPQA